ncbi:MAG: Hpt domain-containing protein [Treponema sp.]|jgi:chemotaxis protein histidine kinase CheA|nr:Hpt domain-containing protein [Treponema sp.]
MALAREKYIGKFIEEALDNIGTVESLIFDIRDEVSLLRAIHTLKGSSRSVPGSTGH